MRFGLVDVGRREMLTPPATANVFSLPVEQLVAINGKSVRGMIAGGERDEECLLAALGRWPRQWPAEVPVRVSFLGMNVGFGCDMQPPCIYCNQPPTAERMGLADWRRVICDVKQEPGEGAYIYVTGGEPLLLGKDIWGRDGLVRTAALAGAACNLNTNALALTPEAALGLVSAGLGRVHVSLDTHRPEVQDVICRCPGRWKQVMRGLYNMQIAKALLGSQHPVIHINCVLTRLNADDFPEFLRFLLAMKARETDVSGSTDASLVSPDLDFHLIPVGGEQNADLRLTSEQYERFFSNTWAAADTTWQAYQAGLGVPEDQRKHLHEKLPFASPYHRVEQRGELREWAECAAAGRPASLAMARRCYVAPTQAFILPDGSQYWCGGHSTSRPTPVGNVLEHSVTENIRRGLGQMASLPGEYCRSCAGATLAINQTVESRLRQTITEWQQQETPEPD